MVEIIPNWHPMFVHFTVALLLIAGAGFIIAHLTQGNRYQPDILKVAKWNFWIGSFITIITVLAGWYAYNAVAHYPPSHAAITEHRNWALATVSIISILAIWLWRIQRSRNIKSSTPFVILIAVLMGLLGTTAWHGGELVYRYGLSVMSLPLSEGNGHDHEHAEGRGYSNNSMQEHNSIEKRNKPVEHDHSTHSH